MKSRLILILFLFLAFASGQAGEKRTGEKKRLVLFATLLTSLPVELSDGAKWMMDEGDTFPMLMFKEQQTKVVLQLAGESFSVPVAHVKVLEAKEVTAAQLASYKRNVEMFLEARSAKWKEQAAKPDRALFPDAVK